MSALKLKTAVVAALVITGVAVPVWQHTELKRVQAENAHLQTGNAQLQKQAAELASLRSEAGRLRPIAADQAELEKLRQWRAQTEPELLRLRGMAGAARRAEAEAAGLRGQLAQKPSDSGSNLMDGPMGDLIKTAMEQQKTAMEQQFTNQLARQLARLTAKLNLSPEQSRAAGEILMRQARVMSAGIQSGFSGKFDKAEIIKLAKEQGNPDEQIKALLTPEQLAAYPSYKQEEAAGNARLMANNELLQMQSSLGLTAEQEDRVFGVLYQQQLDQLSGTVQSAQPAFTDFAGQMQWSLDQKVKALENVLTPAQLATYRQQQEVHLKLTKDILNKMEGANGPK